MSIMDVKPIYELRERLRAAAITGTNLLSEDFRLKRAYEAFKPLETASPVFAKVGQLTGQLLSSGCENPQGALLDTLALADAVVCTLGTVEVTGAVEPAGAPDTGGNAGSMVINAPCSALKELLEALTTSGGGHYGTVWDVHEAHPEFFRDYRVEYAMVQALGASYAELAETVQEWLVEINDRAVLPLLYKDFDPQGKKEMVRRVRVIDAIAGAGANDFYVRMLGGAQKEVRLALIDALRHDTSLLLEMAGTEKGKNKDRVLELLADREEERAEGFFREMAKKKPDAVIKYLKNSTAGWASELVADLCGHFIGDIDAAAGGTGKEMLECAGRLRGVVRALFGKGGARICDCYRKLLMRKWEINQLLTKTWKEYEEKYAYDYDVLKAGVLGGHGYLYETKGQDIETALGKVLHHSLIANPAPELQALALELYQNETDIKFLPAVTTVRFLTGEVSAEWLEAQVTDDTPDASAFSKKHQKRMDAVAAAAAHVCWDKGKGCYELCGYHIDVAYPERKVEERGISLPHPEEIMGWLKSHATGRIDGILSQWVPPDNEEICREMGEYFYKRALVSADNQPYLEYMKTCGWTTCKGLAIQFFKSKRNLIGPGELQDYLSSMPGDVHARMEEARTLSEMMKTGEVNQGNIVVCFFDQWIERQR